MAFKDHVRSARDGLAAILEGWEPPTRKPLSVDPLLAASCLRLGLRSGDVNLAHAAAATLVVFDPDRLWRELLAYAATEAGPFDLMPALAVLAAKKEPTWRRRVGGDWRVATAIIEQLGRQPRSDAPLHLWRLSFSETEHPDPIIQRMAEDAKAIRLGIVRSPDRTLEAERNAESVHERIAEAVGWRLVVASTALWRQNGEGAALMLPVLLAPSGFERLECLEDLNGTSSDVAPTSSERFLAALTHRTRAGREAIREVVAMLPELASHIPGAATEPQVIEAVGDLIGREDADASDRENAQPDKALREASRWAGVPHLSEQEAKCWGETIGAKGPAIAEIRRRHLPAALANFACHGPPSGFQ